MLGADVAYDVQIRDVTMGVDETDLDRIILDMPEPWDVVKHAEGALRPGGILLAYLPTINQTQLLRETLRHHSFGLEETSRYCVEPGTLTGAQCDRITGWSPTPDSLRARAVW